MVGDQLASRYGLHRPVFTDATGERQSIVVGTGQELAAVSLQILGQNAYPDAEREIPFEHDDDQLVEVEAGERRDGVPIGIGPPQGFDLNGPSVGCQYIHGSGAAGGSLAAHEPRNDSLGQIRGDVGEASDQGTLLKLTRCDHPESHELIVGGGFDARYPRRRAVEKLIGPTRHGRNHMPTCP